MKGLLLDSNKLYSNFLCHISDDNDRLYKVISSKEVGKGPNILKMKAKVKKGFADKRDIMAD